MSIAFINMNMNMNMNMSIEYCRFIHKHEHGTKKSKWIFGERPPCVGFSEFEKGRSPCKGLPNFDMRKTSMCGEIL